MTLTIQDLGALGEFLGSIARIGAIQQVFMAAATSTELQEALKEDTIRDVTTNETRRRMYWNTVLANMQWQHMQDRRGLLQTSYEAGRAITLSGWFTTFRSFGEHWENAKSGFHPDFVAWVEEQRANAA